MTITNIDSLFGVNEKDFTFDFTQLFNIGEEAKYCLFPINRKRVYNSIIGKIVEDLKYFFDLYDDLPESYLTVMMNIQDGTFIEGHTEEGVPFGDVNLFIDFLFEQLISDEILQTAIREKVNAEYTISIETRTGEEELQFKDSYAKMVICISIMSRIVIPLICSYMDVMQIKKEQDITINVFNRIFGVFNIDEHGVELDLPQKITKFIKSSVNNTLYSDRVMWEYLKNISVDEHVMSLDLFRKIVRDTIPKLDINKSIVSFLHVVIKQQIMYQFTQNIKINFKPISQIRTDSNESNVSPFQRVEMRLVNSNEMQYTIDKENIKNFIDRRKMRFSPEELAYNTRKVQPNQMQVRLMTHYLGAQDKINVQLCNREEYLYMLMIFRQWLLDQKYYTLAAILTAQIRPKGGRRNLHKGKLVTEIVQSKSYHNILSKYSLIREKIEENKSIIVFIGDIMSTEFEYLPSHDESNDLSSYLEAIEENPKPLISEVLSFLERM
jgi:hypothetical protein